MLRSICSALLLAMLLHTLFSCSKDNKFQFSTDPFSLANSAWELQDCDEDAYLFINGYSICDYMSAIEYTDDAVNISLNGLEGPVTHHLCEMGGNVMIVSIQECGNSTWRSLFEWEVAGLSATHLELLVRVPNILPSYEERFLFRRVQ